MMRMMMMLVAVMLAMMHVRPPSARPEHETPNLTAHDPSPPFPMRLMHRAAGTVRRLVHSAVITLILPRKGARDRASLPCSWQGEMTTGRAQHTRHTPARNAISGVMRPAVSVSHSIAPAMTGCIAQVGGIDMPYTR